MKTILTAALAAMLSLPVAAATYDCEPEDDGYLDGYDNPAQTPHVLVGSTHWSCVTDYNTLKKADAVTQAAVRDACAGR